MLEHLERAPTDQEVAERISAKRAELLGQVRKEMAARSPPIPKTVGAVLLLAIAAGLLAGRPSPTGALAALAAVLGLLGGLQVFSEVEESLKVAEMIGGLPYLLDVSYVWFLPLTVIFCLIVAGSGTWRLAAKEAGAREG